MKQRWNSNETAWNRNETANDSRCFTTMKKIVSLLIHPFNVFHDVSRPWNKLFDCWFILSQHISSMFHRSDSLCFMLIQPVSSLLHQCFITVSSLFHHFFITVSWLFPRAFRRVNWTNWTRRRTPSFPPPALRSPAVSRSSGSLRNPPVSALNAITANTTTVINTIALFRGLRTNTDGERTVAAFNRTVDAIVRFCTLRRGAAAAPPADAEVASGKNDDVKPERIRQRSRR